jgi:bla regulator protein BlaR1
MVLILFINHLIYSSILAGIMVILILAVKKAFRNLADAGWHYSIWFIPAVRLIIPYMSEHELDIDYMSAFLVWMAGAAVLILYSVLYNIYFWSKVKNGKTFTEQGIIKLLEECKEKLGVNVSVSIILTSGVDIPAIFGATRPWLLMPENVLRGLDQEKLRYVILHELAHLKRKDIVFNWIFYVLGMIYWFNPLLWLALRRMRLDREIACDATVLAHIDRDEAKMYGYTILDMAELISSGSGYAGIAGIIEKKSQLQEQN